MATDVEHAVDEATIVLDFLSELRTKAWDHYTADPAPSAKEGIHAKYIQLDELCRRQKMAMDMIGVGQCEIDGVCGLCENCGG
jgi:hypothetical protein